MTDLLRDFCMSALPGKKLKRGRMEAVQMLGEPVEVVGRRADGGVFALRNVCPHRGVPLHYGEIDGVACAAAITAGRSRPKMDNAARSRRSARTRSSTSTGSRPATTIAVRSRARSGCSCPPTGRHRRPRRTCRRFRACPTSGNVEPRFVISMKFDCDVDHAAVGLIDPPHTAYTTPPGSGAAAAASRRTRNGPFVPFGNGFQMAEHKMQNRPPLPHAGQRDQLELTFQLPALRMERAIGDRHSLATMTAITPIDEKTA